jgi:hypothetical protein
VTVTVTGIDVTMVDLNQDGTPDTVIDGDGGHPRHCNLATDTRAQR